MILSDEVLSWFDAHQKEAFDLLVELAQIPAPSNQEEKRVEFVKAWLEKQGAKGVFIDDALNVVYPIGVTESNDVAVYMAHSDVVFPDLTPLPLRIEDGKIHCPGVGDDTANAVALLMTAKYIAENDLQPAGRGVVLVINSGEEGLGNLRGSRKIMETYGQRVKEFVTFDAMSLRIADTSVGSHRYKVEIDTEGGHSYGAFGNRNAIRYLASMIDALYAVKVPEKPGAKTTYNVGLISGGTSVNTIAQRAEMLYEYRSDDVECLLAMKRCFEAVVEAYRAMGIGVEVELVGERGCARDVDESAHAALIGMAQRSVRDIIGADPGLESSSTDANSALNAGVPAICMSAVAGRGCHTREEELDLDSLVTGCRLTMDFMANYFTP